MSLSNAGAMGPDPSDPGTPAPRTAKAARAAARAALREDRARRRRDAWWRRGWRILRRRIGHGLVWLVAPGLVRLLGATWKVERHGVGHFEAVRGGPFLAALWHGRMLTLLPLHRRQGLGVLVSPSRDGALIATILRRSGYRVIRGSTSRQGTRALREMREALQAGGSVVITPDGPRGPRHTVNPGLAWLARETGMPILPVGAAAHPAHELRSWDRFAVPRPRARVAVVYGEALRVPGDADSRALEETTEALRQALMALEGAAAAHLGILAGGAQDPGAMGR